MEDGHQRHTKYHHRYRQTEIILHKAHPICISLPGHRKKGYSTGLRSHHTQQNQSPWHLPITQKIPFQVLRRPALINAISNYNQQCAYQNRPVYPGKIHLKVLVMMVKRIINTARTPSTNRYQEVQEEKRGIFCFDMFLFCLMLDARCWMLNQVFDPRALVFAWRHFCSPKISARG